MKTHVSTISSKGQVTVPADVRRQLGVEAGDQITFVTTDDGKVEIQPVRYTLESVIGSIEALPGETADLDLEIERATAEEAARKMRRWKLG